MFPALRALIAESAPDQVPVEDVLRAAKIAPNAPERWAARGQMPSRAAMDRLAEVTGIAPERIAVAVAADAGVVPPRAPASLSRPAGGAVASWRESSPKRISVRTGTGPDAPAVTLRAGHLAAVTASGADHGEAIRSVAAVLAHTDPHDPDPPEIAARID